MAAKKDSKNREHWKVHSQTYRQNSNHYWTRKSSGCPFHWPRKLFNSICIDGLMYELREAGTRRERLKSALYLRLKKRKTFFLEKKT